MKHAKDCSHRIIRLKDKVIVSADKDHMKDMTGYVSEIISDEDNIVIVNFDKPKSNWEGHKKAGFYGWELKLVNLNPPLMKI